MINNQNSHGEHTSKETNNQTGDKWDNFEESETTSSAMELTELWTTCQTNGTATNLAKSSLITKTTSPKQRTLTDYVKKASTSKRGTGKEVTQGCSSTKSPGGPQNQLRSFLKPLTQPKTSSKQINSTTGEQNTGDQSRTEQTKPTTKDSSNEWPTNFVTTLKKQGILMHTTQIVLQHNSTLTFEEGLRRFQKAMTIIGAFEEALRRIDVSLIKVSHDMELPQEEEEEEEEDEEEYGWEREREPTSETHQNTESKPSTKTTKVTGEPDGTKPAKPSKPQLTIHELSEDDNDEDIRVYDDPPSDNPLFPEEEDSDEDEGIDLMKTARRDEEDLNESEHDGDLTDLIDDEADDKQAAILKPLKKRKRPIVEEYDSENDVDDYDAKQFTYKPYYNSRYPKKPYYYNSKTKYSTKHGYLL